MILITGYKTQISAIRSDEFHVSIGEKIKQRVTLGTSINLEMINCIPRLMRGKEISREVIRSKKITKIKAQVKER